MGSYIQNRIHSLARLIETTVQDYERAVIDKDSAFGPEDRRLARQINSVTRKYLEELSAIK